MEKNGDVTLPDVTGDGLKVTTEDQQQQHTSANSSTADEASSIEALNWSDFEDEEPSSAVDAAMLQSIHSQLSDDGIENELKWSTSTVSEEQTIIDDSKESESLRGEVEKIDKDDLLLGDDKGLKLGRQGMKRKRAESPMVSSTLSAVSATSETTGDLSSNAAVLDDGPIWAKGSKRYKFEENRRMNQKLTFGVLFSIVLAVGLGLGNLVAYNECESEHKTPEVPVSFPKSSIPPQASQPAITDEMMQAIPFPAVPSPIQVIPSPEVRIPPKEVPDLAKSSRPMVDPKYSQHAEELSKVLKMLDELSRKIDRFENTTRQLGGIVMMQDEIRQRQPPSKKTKFLKLLSELMQTKRMKQMDNKAGDGVREKTWRDKKEEVLDEIAGVVLEAMRDEDLALDRIVEKEEILLDDSQVFPLEGEEEKLLHLQEEPLPPAQVQKTVFPTEELIADSLELPDEISDEFILSRVNSKVKQYSTNKNQKDEGFTKKLKRDYAVDMDDDEYEMKIKKKHKHSREEFQQEKKPNREEFQKERKYNGEQIQGGKKQKPEAFEKQKKEFQKRESKKAKNDGSSQAKQKKEKNEFKPDWSNLRAKNREAIRRAAGDGKIKESKVNNWQAERSKIREQYRGKRPTN